ncbi:MAG: hypothetical protein JWR03_428, partial [Cohnella sp.]|nr:hypothetical protein [Cohnella sp.]
IRISILDVDDLIRTDRIVLYVADIHAVILNQTLRYTAPLEYTPISQIDGNWCTKMNSL